MKKVLNNIKEIREARGISLMDLTRQYQAKIALQNFLDDLEIVREAEDGRDIYVSDITALSAALGVSVSDLYPEIK